MIVGIIGGNALTIVFWVSLALPVYSYVIYPLFVAVIGGVVARAGARSQQMAEGTGLPPLLAVVVAAHNEEAHVAALISSLRAAYYPPERLKIYVGSDGSTDGTVTVLKQLTDERLRVRAFDVNRGKATVLNDLMSEVTEPIVVFTDANTTFDRDALRTLARRFEDARVGCVCGELVLKSAGSGDNIDNLYWKVERFLKWCESAVGALLGANGAIYAIRRELFRPLRADTIVDDFCISMTVRVEGYRLIYEPRARAYEEMPADLRDEFRRRVRIGIGNYQAFFRHPEYCFKTGPVAAFAYLSHKVLRWFTPHCLVVALGCSLALSRAVAFRWTVAVQLAAYGLLFALYHLNQRKPLLVLLRIPVFLAMLNAAFAVGFWRYVSGAYGGAWQRTSRTTGDKLA